MCDVYSMYEYWCSSMFSNVAARSLFRRGTSEIDVVEFSDARELDAWAGVPRGGPDGIERLSARSTM